MRRGGAAVVALALAAALTGCVQIPDGGPVNTAGNAGNGRGDQEQVFVPRGPQARESGPDIVTHFFEAMTASPMSATVAREFLTRSAADSWSPEDGYLVYDSMDPPVGIGNLEVTLNGVNMFDSRGRWTGSPPGGKRVVDVAMDVENGQQWRIAAVPNLLMVPSTWFETNTLPMSVYYFDPGGDILVPEPVYVPQGEQMPSLLIRALLQGPADARVERSFVPQGTALDDLSVTVSPDGVADIPLAGDLSNVPPDTVEKMAVQFGWALRQVPGITAARITVDGHPIPLPGGSTTFGVDTGASYDPAGIYARGEMYGLSGGLAVRVVDGEAQTLLVGPFGQRSYGLGDVSVDLDAGLIAGVTKDRKSVILSSVTGSDGLQPRTVLRGGVDILHPAWDIADRMWVVDRRTGEAVVSVVRNGRIAPIDIPGITGQNVIDFLVSRDGTRIVAAIRQGPSDRIVMSRTFTTGPKSTLRGSMAKTIVLGEGEALRIRDIGWRSPTQVYYLKAVAGRQSELRSTVVDGSPSDFDPDAISGIFADLAARLISSPRPEEPVYLRKPGGSFEPIVSGLPRVTADASALHYVG
jgi:hypothetical protein